MGTVLETDTVSWAKRSLVQRGRALWSTATARQGALSVVDQGVASGTNFLTGVIIARACSKEEFGLYMLGFSLILFVSNLQTSLVATPYMIYAPRIKGGAHALYTGSTMIHQMALCFLTMLALMGGAIAIGQGLGPHGLGPVLWALVAVVAFIMLRLFARQVCFACLKVKKAFLLDSGVASCQIAGLLLLANFGLLSASRAYWVIGLACGTAVLAWLWSEKSFYRLKVAESAADLKKNWTFAKWVFASGLVWTVSVNVYPWFLAFFHGTASTGVWAACLGVVALANPGVVGAQNFLGPKISHVYAKEGARALRRLVLIASAVFALASLLFCLPMIFWGGSLVVMLYGPNYTNNGLVVSILAFNVAVCAVAFSFSRALLAVERADVDFFVNFASLFVMATMGIWLVRDFGTLGAAYGLLGASVATLGVRAWVFLALPCISIATEKP